MSARSARRSAQGTRRISAAELQRILTIATLVVVVVILATLATVVLYGLQLQSAPRTLQERTLAVAETAVAESPDQYESWLALAYAQIEVGRYSAATESIEQGKAVEDTAGFYIAEAYLVESQGRTEEAIELYEKAKERAIAEREERNQELQAVGVKLETPNTDLADAAIGKARLLATIEELTASVAEYDIALEVQPQMSDILVERGDVKARLGDTTGARADYESALTFIPDMPEALDGLARLEAGGQ